MVACALIAILGVIALAWARGKTSDPTSPGTEEDHESSREWAGSNFGIRKSDD